MTVKSTYQKLLKERTTKGLVSRGAPPVEAAVPDTDPVAITLPPLKAGETGTGADWSLFLDQLNLALDSLEQAVDALSVDSKSGTWKEIETNINALDTALRIKQGANSTTCTFNRLPYISDLPANNLPLSSCDVNYHRGYACLKRADNACCKVSLAGARIWWYTSQSGIRVQQIGSIESVLDEDDTGWAATAAGNTDIDLIIDIIPAAGTTANGLTVDITGRIDGVRVEVNGSAAEAVDRGPSWFIFPEQEVNSIRVTITKSGYDNERAGEHYLCIREIALRRDRFESEGVYISHAIKVSGSRAAVVLDASQPRGTSISLMAGIQKGLDIDWTHIESGEWIPLTKGSKTEEYFTVNTNTTASNGGLYEIHRFEHNIMTDSLELYPGAGMWVAESIPVNGTAAPTLAVWKEALANTASAKQELVDSAGGLVLQAGRLYHFYTYLKVEDGDPGRIESWLPQPLDVPYNVYVNWLELQRGSSGYSADLARGWNIIEIVAAADETAFFDPMLDFSGAASVSSITGQSSKLVPKANLALSSTPRQISLAAVDSGRLYLNCLPFEAGLIRFQCRYYIDTGEMIHLRVMAVMKSISGTTTPLLNGYTVIAE